MPNTTEGDALDTALKLILTNDKISEPTREFIKSLIGDEDKKLAMLSTMVILMEMRPSLFLQMIATVTYKGKVRANASWR